MRALAMRAQHAIALQPDQLEPGIRLIDEGPVAGGAQLLEQGLPRAGASAGLEAPAIARAPLPRVEQLQGCIGATLIDGACELPDGAFGCVTMTLLEVHQAVRERR